MCTGGGESARYRPTVAASAEPVNTSRETSTHHPVSATDTATRHITRGMPRRAILKDNTAIARAHYDVARLRTQHRAPLNESTSHPLCGNRGNWLTRRHSDRYH